MIPDNVRQALNKLSTYLITRTGAAGELLDKDLDVVKEYCERVSENSRAVAMPYTFPHNPKINVRMEIPLNIPKLPKAGGVMSLNVLRIEREDDGSYTAVVEKPYPAMDNPPVATYQRRVDHWMMECFGTEISADIRERCDRFMEEDIELVQSLGYDRTRITTLIDYVYSRPVGEPKQEVGGVVVTLNALCSAAKIDLTDAAETELTRIWTKVDAIREKQKSKRGLHTPLPVPPTGT